MHMLPPPAVLQGYSLGEASLQFEIAAQLTYAGASSNSSSSSEKLTLSPSLPIALSTGRTLAAKLLGDLAGYTQLPVLRWGPEYEALNSGRCVPVSGAGAITNDTLLNAGLAAALLVAQARPPVQHFLCSSF